MLRWCKIANSAVICEKDCSNCDIWLREKGHGCYINTLIQTTEKLSDLKIKIAENVETKKV